MLGKLAKLPLRVAHRVARVIQEQDARKHAASPAAPAAEVPRAGPAIDPNELADLPVQSVTLPVQDLLGRSVCWVDVRDADRAAGIPGAIRMSLREVTIRLAELPPDERVVVYDEEGGENARVAVLFMRARGLEDVWILGGGLRAWTQAGGATRG